MIVIDHYFLFQKSIPDYFNFRLESASQLLRADKQTTKI